MSSLATLGVFAASLLAQSSSYYDYSDTAALSAATSLFGISSVVSIVVGLCSFIIGIALFALNIWMIIDCNKRTEAELANKQTWFILLIVGIFFGFGWLVAIIYYFTVKKKLDPAVKK